MNANHSNATIAHFRAEDTPVVQIDAHLPKLEPPFYQEEYIKTVFTNPRGYVDWNDWNNGHLDANAIQSSVLVGFVLADSPSLIFIQRSTKLRNHAGQIAFPGGKRESGDSSPVQTASREAYEEIGLPVEKINILGVLPDYRTVIAPFCITPVVAIIERNFLPFLDGFEVDEVFQVPLAFLFDPSNHHWHISEYQGIARKWLAIPYQENHKTRFIWGATAHIVRQLYERLLPPSCTLESS
ncbi:MAG: CoA pyrophosphatase [Gammaproteobacteria bacterium]|nr:CoA pyrophosphatase [Gammaproteobacteria bacterium]